MASYQHCIVVWKAAIRRRLLRGPPATTGTSAVMTRVPPAGVIYPHALGTSPRAARSSKASGSADDGRRPPSVPAAGAGCHTGSMSSSSSARRLLVSFEDVDDDHQHVVPTTLPVGGGDKLLGGCLRVGRHVVRIWWISLSSTSSDRPSQQTTKRSRRTIGSVQASTRTEGSMPSARVMMLRRGCLGCLGVGDVARC